MHAEKPTDILSKGSMLNPGTDQEVAAAMAEHTHFLNTWLESRLSHLAITLDIAAEEATANDNAECQRLVAAVRQELRLTEKLIVPLAEFRDAEGEYSPLPPGRMAAALAQTRAGWVDFVAEATGRIPA